MSILIVDDSPEVRSMLQIILESEGYQPLLIAESPREAFQYLGLDNPNSPPTEVELVLMDVQMPDLDGIEACRQIKAVDRFRDIPVIMVTAMAETGFLEAAFAAGAMDYVTKPLNRVELLTRMRSALRLKREMDRRKARELELEQALRENKVLQGLLPICATCKQIRDDHGTWKRLEDYISEHSEATFTHGICGECARKIHPDWDETP